MKSLYICLIALSLSILPALADEMISDESVESTTETLENSTTETEANEEKITTDDQQPAQVEEKESRPRSKWDFSDRPKDKKNKKNKEIEKQNADKNKNKKFTSPTILNDTENTWKSPTSGKIRQSTYSK